MNLPIKKIAVDQVSRDLFTKSIKRDSYSKVCITFKIVSPVIGQHLLKFFKAHLSFTYNAGSVYPFLVYKHGSLPQRSQDLYCRTDIR